MNKETNRKFILFIIVKKKKKKEKEKEKAEFLNLLRTRTYIKSVVKDDDSHFFF